MDLRLCTLVVDKTLFCFGVKGLNQIKQDGGLKPPTNLQLTERDGNWKTFKQRFTLYIEALESIKRKRRKRNYDFLESCG